MARQNQPDRYESLILAAALAVAGTLFLFDQLSVFRILHSAPALLVGVGASLIRAAAVTGPTGNQPPREGRDA
jgi:4-amino-4-deoxy-L-arabinose transferase-like glycosyltransferase